MSHTFKPRTARPIPKQSKGQWLNFLVMLVILVSIIFARCQAPSSNQSWIQNFILPTDLYLPKSITDLVQKGKRSSAIQKDLLLPVDSSNASSQ